MRTTIASLMVLFTLAIGAGVAGCGDDDDATGTSGASGSSGGSVAAGKATADQLVCTSCHGEDYAGGKASAAINGPNITQSKTVGIGSWTDAQISGAINDGKDDEGEALCPSMAKYGLDAATMANLIAYLRTIPANETVSDKLTCP